MKYFIKHIGSGSFEAYFDDGSIKSVGKNLCGMIRYTYFEDFSYPPDDWFIDNLTLLSDYNRKLSNDTDFLESLKAKN